jgi:LEA14-like dessication related protein
MTNPNDFDLQFKRLDYLLKLDGNTFAQTSALSQNPVQSNGQKLMNLGINVSFAQLGRSAYGLLNGNRAQYAMEGEMVFDAPDGGERKVPFSLTGLVPFHR